MTFDTAMTSTISGGPSWLRARSSCSPDGLGHRVGEAPILHDGLADRGVPVVDHFGQLPLTGEHLRMIKRAGQDVELADAMHHAAQQRLVGVDLREVAREHIRVGRDVGTAFPQLAQLRLDGLELLVVLHLVHREGHGRGAHHVVADAADGRAQFRDRLAAAVQRGRIGDAQQAGRTVPARSPPPAPPVRHSSSHRQGSCARAARFRERKAARRGPWTVRRRAHGRSQRRQERRYWFARWPVFRLQCAILESSAQNSAHHDAG